jgi:hypothetical protein
MYVRLMPLQLERWSGDCNNNTKQPPLQEGAEADQQASYQYSLQLLVAPGQLELGRRLITAMYSSSPDLSDLEAPQLLQLLTLAECYGVCKVITAAADQLHKLTVETMPLEVAAAVFGLPEGCLGLEQLSPVVHTALDKLQEELGDLEESWGNTKKQQLLLGLPLDALRYLLWDGRTRVASEDTAVYTAARWLEANPGGGEQAAKSLVKLLRLAHCTPTFLSTGEDKGCVRALLRAGGVTDRTLMQLCAMRGVTDNQRLTWMAQAGLSKVWGLLQGPRLASAVGELTITWPVPLSLLKAAFAEAQRAAAAGDDPPFVCHTGVVWQGRVWSLWLGVGADGACSLCIDTKPSAACCKVQLWYRDASGVTHGDTLDRCVGSGMMFSGQGQVVFNWGPGKTWGEVRAWLAEKQMVRTGGGGGPLREVVQLGATVTEVA